MVTGSESWTEAAPARKPIGATLHGVLFWLLLLALATAGLSAFRSYLGEAHAVLIYLLIVLGTSSRQGRVAGLAVAVLAFLSFNFFLLSPYHTFILTDPRDWLVLGVFLITGAVAAQQLYHAQREAEAARRRATEIDRLATLGAETLNAGRAEEAVQAIAEMIRATLGIGSCEIYLRLEGEGFLRIARAARAETAEETVVRATDLYDHVMEQEGVAVEGMAGTSHIATGPGISLATVLLENPDARVVIYPLRVRDRGVGVLRLAGAEALRLNEPQRRFTEALAYYAALGVERVRLTAEAERAHVLREADRLKDALLAAVSHDLRTPLTTIKALAYEIRVDGDERAARVEEEADRLNRFVSDLLDLSLVDGGALRLELELNAVDDLVSSALQQAAGISGNQEIRVDLPGDELLIGRFDFTHSLRALVNLIENACKYSPPGAPVDLVVRREDDFLVFQVSDLGPGVAEPDRERIFEPFYRSGGPSDAGGTGLGLSIARRFAEAQGGRVDYSSRPGGRSVFTLALPAAAFDAVP